MASSSPYHANPGDPSDVHHLLCAAQIGDLPVFKRRVKEIKRLGLKIEDVRDEKDDQTAFHVAAEAGRTQICRYLVEEEKIDIDLKDADGRTPLHAASLGRHFQTAAYLLEKGADPNTPSILLRTSLHYAVESGIKKLVELVIKKGAKVDAVSNSGTPLVHAALRGHKDIAKLLIDNGADINAISYELTTPLLTAIVFQSVECVKLLLKEGADPNLYGSRRFLPLAQAAREGQAEMVACLVKAGADPNVTNCMGLTPIEVAASNNFLQCVMILFPVTSRIPAIPEWSVAGIFKHARSAGSVAKVEQKLKEHFLMCKSKGEEDFKKKDYYGAIKWYTEASHCDQYDAAVLSNKSLCWVHLNEGGIALNKAEACIILRPDWAKAYYRAGAAYMLLKQYKKASISFESAWMLEPQNNELERAYREAEDNLNNVHI